MMHVCCFSVQLSSLKTETDRIQSEKEKVRVNVLQHQDMPASDGKKIGHSNVVASHDHVLQNQKQTAEPVMSHG